jgi:hypothetical protein
MMVEFYQTVLFTITPMRASKVALIVLALNSLSSIKVMLGDRIIPEIRSN